MSESASHAALSTFQQINIIKRRNVLGQTKIDSIKKSSSLGQHNMQYWTLHIKSCQKINMNILGENISSGVKYFLIKNVSLQAKY